MANGNNTKWFGLALAALALLGTIIATFVWAQADIKAVDTKALAIIEDVDDLKADGCKPSSKNTNSINVINYRLDALQKTQNQVQSDTKEILRRLPK